MLRSELFSQSTEGSSGRPEQLSDVDYRLARNSVIRNFKGGRLSRLDVCDAHPELVRAARNVGDLTNEECPICEGTEVTLVSYAFGSGLDSGGHTITDKDQLRRLARRTSEITCYVVEVCPHCSWNHLARAFRVAGSRRRNG